MAENNIMGIVGAFIGIAIMLGIGIQILGNSIQDCSTLPDYSEGEVISATVTNAGNYTNAPVVSFTGGGGSLATATVTTSATGGGNVRVASITITEGGQDYTSAPTVVITNTTGTVVTPATATAAISTPTSQIGWAGQCISNNTQTQNAYTLLVIILIVVAAVAILSVIRMLG